MERRQAPTRKALALASLALGIIGFCVGTYDIAVQSHDIDSYTGGSDPLSYRIMLFLVLPCGIVGIGLGARALASLAQHPARAASTGGEHGPAGPRGVGASPRRTWSIDQLTAAGMSTSLPVATVGAAGTHEEECC